MYISVRLAHRSFTLGELGLVSVGATALFMEMANLTIARVRFFQPKFPALTVKTSSDMADDDAVH